MNSDTYDQTGFNQYTVRNSRGWQFPNNSLPSRWLRENIDVISTHHGMLKRLAYIFKHLVRSTLNRKLVAVFYADVMNYSGLTEENEEETHRRFLLYMDIVSATINANGGKISRYSGDSVLASFNEATSALRCALTTQRKLSRLNSRFPFSKQINFRIGLNLGEVISDRGAVFGNAVNIAARLEGLAEPGGICVSDSIKASIGNQLSINYIALGEQFVKNICKPVRSYRIDMSAVCEPPTTSVANVVKLQPQLE